MNNLLNKFALSCLAALPLLLVSSGCRHLDRARAGYHEDRAHEAFEHGHVREGMRQERKAERAEHDAQNDPLP